MKAGVKGLGCVWARGVVRGLCAGGPRGEIRKRRWRVERAVTRERYRRRVSSYMYRHE